MIFNSERKRDDLSTKTILRYRQRTQYDNETLGYFPNFSDFRKFSDFPKIFMLDICFQQGTKGLSAKDQKLKIHVRFVKKTKKHPRVRQM